MATSPPSRTRQPAKTKQPAKAKKATAAATKAKAATTTRRRVSIKGVSISPEERVLLYAQARYLPRDFSKKTGLLLPFTTYFQDPFVGKKNPEDAFDTGAYVAWEPGLNDGPTSSRFAVVDYNADTGTLEPPAIWDEHQHHSFIGPDGKPIDQNAASSFAFHQVNVWVLLQNALGFFEDASALGRTIPWAFEGNRLIVVPHAGYGENAFYDRKSKSLQFYYFASGKKTVYTCLSTDIVSHEFGHAVLDGVRPLLNESSSVETAAFHEFVGDLTAILITLRNNSLRRKEADRTKGKLADATTLSSIAEEFGDAVEGRPYLRSATNNLKMSAMAGESSAHRMSEVLTGAMFDILIGLGSIYQKRNENNTKPASARTIFWWAADRMQRMAIQPLDLLPPVEVTFKDYALAVCRTQRLADPIDPFGYLDLVIDVFVNREILTAEDATRLREPKYLNDRLQLSVSRSIDSISRSRAAAYRFLDDNREDLLIPAGRDFFVADLYDAKKRARQDLPMPRQIIVQYAWREEVKLDGPQFGKFSGRLTTMLCGGTLVFDDNGIVLSWTMKPGSLPYGGKRERTGKIAERWSTAVLEGLARRQALLEGLAAQIAAGRVGSIAGSEKGLLGFRVPPVAVESDANEVLKFKLTPHMNLSTPRSEQEDEEAGEQQWQISC